MVTVTSTGEGVLITLTPNRSLEWNQIKLWIMILSFPAIIIAILWSMIGVWIILPFAGIELVLLTSFMYYICYYNYRQQQIFIATDFVSITSGIHQPLQEKRYSKQSCYLWVKRPNHPIENLELKIIYENLSISIGEFLNQHEREKTRRAIIQAGMIECSNRWWETHS